MLFQYLLLSALSGAAPAALSLIARTPEWTLVNFNRHCEDAHNTCRYTFKLRKSTDPEHVFTHCTYQIKGTATKSARFSDYSQVKCEGAQHISLNQGWYSDNSFMTLVVTDSTAKTWAFFGYTAQEIAGDGVIVFPNHVSHALPLGQFSKRSHTGPGWSVIDLSRDCTQNNTCAYAFGIDFNDYTGVKPCSITNVGTATSPASTQSFYAVSCKEHPTYVISWGYNPEFGFATMTVVSGGFDAFFGFNNVNGQTSWATVGPNVVYPVGTFGRA